MESGAYESTGRTQVQALMFVTSLRRLCGQGAEHQNHVSIPFVLQFRLNLLAKYNNYGRNS